MTKTTTAEIDPIDAEILALLEEEEAAIEAAGAVAETEEPDLEEIEAAAEIIEAKAASYAEQEPDTAGDEEEAKPISGKRSKSKTVTILHSAPAKTGPISKPSQLLSVKMDPVMLAKAAWLDSTDAFENDDEAKAHLFDTVDKLAVKVADKATNLIRFADMPGRLQIYTTLALDKLIADGELDSAGIFSLYKGNSYSDGTARSQGSQLMQLLPALKIATRDGKSLKLNQESKILERYTAAKAAMTAAA